MNVFFSWQSDISKSRNFIHSSLKSAISQLNKDFLLVEPERSQDSIRRHKVILDQDTQGILGIPEIASTILQKILKCDVFVADVSFVGKNNKNSKKLPNPNVLFELGYALGKIGGEKIVLVMDSETGSFDDLPFDLRNRRRPIQFSTAQTQSKREFTATLVKILEAYHQESRKSSPNNDDAAALFQFKIEIERLFTEWKVADLRYRVGMSFPDSHLQIMKGVGEELAALNNNSTLASGPKVSLRSLRRRVDGLTASTKFVPVSNTFKQQGEQIFQEIFAIINLWN